MLTQKCQGRHKEAKNPIWKQPPFRNSITSITRDSLFLATVSMSSVNKLIEESNSNVTGMPTLRQLISSNQNRVLRWVVVKISHVFKVNIQGLWNAKTFKMDSVHLRWKFSIANIGYFHIVALVLLLKQRIWVLFPPLRHCVLMLLQPFRNDLDDTTNSCTWN